MSTTPKITRENYRASLAGFWAMAEMVAEAPLDEMLAAAERAAVVGPLLDPTLYREKGPALHEDIEMLRALAHVKSAIESIRRRRAAAS